MSLRNVKILLSKLTARDGLSQLKSAVIFKNVSQACATYLKRKMSTSQKFSSVFRATRQTQPGSKLKAAASNSIQDISTSCEQFLRKYRGAKGSVIFGLKDVQYVDKTRPESSIRIFMTFMNFQAVCTEEIRIPSEGIGSVHVYPVEVTENFVENVANRSVIFEVYSIVENGKLLVATGDLYLKSILVYPEEKVAAVVDLYTFNVRKRVLPSLFGSLSLKIQFTSREFSLDKDDIFSSESDLMPAPISSEKEIRVLPVTKEELAFDDSLFKVDPERSSASNQSQVKEPFKMPDWKRSMEEYAVLKGFSTSIAEVSRWKDASANPVPIRNYAGTASPFNKEIVITVKKLVVKGNSPIANSPEIEQLYIDYAFLSYGGPKMESLTMEKPKDETPVEYNFKRSFIIDPSQRLDDCKLMAHMIQEEGFLKFDLVSEPIDDKSHLQTCELVGTGAVNLFELVQEEENELNLKVPILTPTDKIYVGYFAVNIAGVQAMREVALGILDRRNSKSETF